MVSGKSFEEDPELPDYLVSQAQDQLATWPVVVIIDDVKQQRVRPLFYGQPLLALIQRVICMPITNEAHVSCRTFSERRYC